MFSSSFFSPLSAGSVHFGGSRSLAPSALVGQVVASVLAAGRSVRAGCAIGADQCVISAALVQPARLHVFAAFSGSGSGSWSGSAVSSVLAAAAAGAQVSFLAGGSLSVPLVGRLMARSRAALSGCAASVFFLASPSSPGSLAVAACAVRVGQPVFAFCASVPSSPRGCVGRWVPSFFFSFPCWRWVPAQSRLF
jgi:hypothetical protein